MGMETTIESGRREATGTQCIQRSFAIVRLLAGGDCDGEKLVDIAGSLKLSHPTAHRILKALEQEGIVERASGTQRYRLAAETAWLGVAPFNRCPITRLAVPTLEDLASRTGDSIFLSVPSHNDSVYADRRFGNFPLQAQRIKVGARRPLGVSIGGRVMLAFLGDERLANTLRDNAERFADWRCPEAAVVDGVEAARSQGYLSQDSLVDPTRHVLAVPVRDVVGRAVGAISIIAPISRLRGERATRLLPLLRAGAREVGQALGRQRVSA
ncbi:IclR family transcriptional regulator [Paracoccus sp. MBLB3053]|uniref:IclR family transcriptional regulator n=1 Tax=Paracoccus aurantius TaxID=3073814 RepID=A0ABU2HXX2_9RHOB|nr:IclR family transcriptional regulator [Paracoccus sp. MBLB3053]MDS9469900.1 IclR family transcriptional regulator [Paracoccus sp. MBLB3053]